ncbi:hypothetical protein [Micromonospora sp. CP22]|uniref:effector-associated constant component EACC1 n=1 Tax=Micromonospora sp. CP22 TaxID=2580517 RepID=UPI0012BC7787|nr:hypothetical protein [Micromonospora sp. CP22]MTK05451.1 hypothetical protein [Micromonospora sp. CP22]
MGIETAAIIAALSSVAAISSALTAVRAWLSSRREQPRIKVTVGDKSLELDLDDPEQAERFLKDYLSRNVANERESAG